MEYKDYYKILGVPKGADDKAIKTAYRRLARKHHPDVSKGKESAARFQEVAEAYEVLSDAEKRKRYDTLGPDWQRYAEAGAAGRSPFDGAPFGAGEVRFTRGGEGFSDFFRTIFGDLGGRRTGGGFREPEFVDLSDFAGAGSDRGGDVEAAIELTLEEAFTGVSRSISLELDEPCPTCGGSGHVNRKPCPQCHGGGWAKGRRNLEVKIPAGVDTGSRIRVAGEGAGGTGRGGRGDIFLHVTVRPDPRFERKGDDLYVTLPVSAPEAALGTEISVPTLKGQVSMKVPPETSGGRTFRLPGYGMPRLKGSGAGDQYVRVQLTIPSGLSPRERELYEELKNLRTERTR
ncbi:MAG TPA: DnaJ C-terminal domain-containing protein [Candidatus Bathyarchaeia archaeon]|nr:DnaJ C-terminal domain-containing protein [Candidatus Bathyarchaeia archaeon]